MLDDARDHVTVALSELLHQSLDRQIVRLRRSRCEDHLPWITVDQGRHLLARRLDQLGGVEAEGVLPAGRVPELIREGGQHRLHDPGITGGGGVVIQIDGGIDDEL